MSWKSCGCAWKPKQDSDWGTQGPQRSLLPQSRVTGSWPWTVIFFSMNANQGMRWSNSTDCPVTFEEGTVCCPCWSWLFLVVFWKMWKLFQTSENIAVSILYWSSSLHPHSMPKSVFLLLLPFLLLLFQGSCKRMSTTEERICEMSGESCRDVRSTKQETYRRARNLKRHLLFQDRLVSILKLWTGYSMYRSFCRQCLVNKNYDFSFVSFVFYSSL